MENDKTPFARWRALDESGKVDDFASDLDEALFLYALRRVQDADPADLTMIWTTCHKSWEERLPLVAYKYVERVCAGLMTAYEIASTTGVSLNEAIQLSASWLPGKETPASVKGNSSKHQAS